MMVWLHFPAPQLSGARLHSRADVYICSGGVPRDSHHGITEPFGAATFDLKPLVTRAQNALLACASRGDATLQHEKAAEGEQIK